MGASVLIVEIVVVFHCSAPARSVITKIMIVDLATWVLVEPGC